MAFHVYPDPQDGPFWLRTGVTPPIGFEELVASGTGAMVLRGVVLSTDCGPPTTAPPGIILVADGVETEVTSTDGQDPTPVADGRAYATVYRPVAGARGVFRVEVYKVASEPIEWQLRIDNRAFLLGLVFVVADSATQSRQPWMEMSADLTADTRPWRTVTRSLQIANRGTGPLTVTDAAPTSPAPGLSVAALPVPVSPNACGTLVFSFTGPNPGNSTVELELTSNDTTAGTDVGEPGSRRHSRRAGVRLTTHPVWPGLAAGDVLVVDTSAFVEPNHGMPAFGGGGLIRIAEADGWQIPLATAGLLASVSGIAVEASGDLLLSCMDAVIRVDRGSGDMRPVSTSGALRNAGHIVIAPDGGVLVADVADGRITRVDPQTGAQTPFMWSWQPSPNRGMAFTSDNHLLIGFGSDSAAVRRFDPATGEPRSDLFHRDGYRLDAFCLDGAGIAYVAASKLPPAGSTGPEEYQIIRVDPATGLETVVFRRSDYWPQSLALSANGALLALALDRRAGLPDVPVLLRQKPGDIHAGNWLIEELSRGFLLRSPLDLAVVPNPPTG